MKKVKFMLLVLFFALPHLADDEADLRSLDRGIVTATVAQDAGWFEKNLTPDYVLTTSRGSMISRADLLRDLKLVKIEPYEPSEVVVRIYGDSAVITGRIVQKYSTNGEHIEADLRYTDVWLKTKEGWKNSAGHASAIKVTRTKEETR